MKLVFWLAVGIVAYAYFGYFVLLAILSLFVRKEPTRKDITPPLTIIVTAHNEERRIQEKLDNTLGIDYPQDSLEIIVASDCSTDKTDDIVESYKDRGVRLVRPDVRKGKEYAQYCAVREAQGEILIFTDVATIIPEKAVKEMVSNFSDTTVGCVSSEDKTISDTGELEGEGMYVRYEMTLRRLEARVNSLVGLSGSFFAARKAVCSPWRTDLQSDFNTLFNSVKQGLYGVPEPRAFGIYKNVKDSRKEFTRKIRTVVRGINVFMNNIEVLNFTKYGLFSLQIFSHKLCRWLVPFCLIAAFVSNIVLIGDLFYGALMMLQLLFYGTAIFGSQVSVGALRIPYFFVVVNASILVAWFKYITGERFVTWQPSKR